jgi:hypothetical protein
LSCRIRPIAIEYRRHCQHLEDPDDPRLRLGRTKAGDQREHLDDQGDRVGHRSLREGHHQEDREDQEQQRDAVVARTREQ